MSKIICSLIAAFGASALFGQTAYGDLSVSPVSPHSFYSSSSTSAGTLFLSNDSTVLDTNSGFLVVSTASTQCATDGNCSGLIQFNVQSSSEIVSTGKRLVWMVGASTGSDFAIVPIASARGSVCGSGSSQCQGGDTVSGRLYYRGVLYESEEGVSDTSLVTLGLKLADICAYTSSSTLTGGLCSGGIPVAPTARAAFGTSGTTRSLTLKLFLVDATDASTVPTTLPTTDSTRYTLPLVVTVQGSGNPAISAGVCSTKTTTVYFPGDSEIKLSPSVLSATTWASTDSKISKVVFVAQNGANPNTLIPAFTANPIYRALVPTDSDVTVTGFANTTTGADNVYRAIFGVRDEAGAVAFDTSCNIPVQTADIQTFLKANQCFIATASFRSLDGGALPLLRKFRDQVLNRSSIGRALVRGYYTWSPGAAQWLVENSELRYVVLAVLIPFQLVAWIALHAPVWTGVFGLSLLLVMSLLKRSRGRVIQ
jgi:hypothetical protein